MDDGPFSRSAEADGRRPSASDLKPDAASACDPADKHADVTALYKAYADRLAASLRGMFGNGPPDPEDVTQHAFQKLIERPDRSDIRDLRAFLWRTARNTFLKAIRKEAVRTRYDFEIENLFFPARGDDSTPERVLEVEEELEAINEALRQMPEKRRHAFVLHKVEGLTVVEVARRLNISRTPTQKHITRAAQQIEVYLAEKKRGRTT